MILTITNGSLCLKEVAMGLGTWPFGAAIKYQKKHHGLHVHAFRIGMNKHPRREGMSPGSP